MYVQVKIRSSPFLRMFFQVCSSCQPPRSKDINTIHKMPRGASPRNTSHIGGNSLLSHDTQQRQRPPPLAAVAARRDRCAIAEHVGPDDGRGRRRFHRDAVGIVAAGRFRLESGGRLSGVGGVTHLVEDGQCLSPAAAPRESCDARVVPELGRMPTSVAEGWAEARKGRARGAEKSER